MPEDERDVDEKTAIREAPETSPRPRQNAYFIVISGKSVGKMFKITAPEMVIGRATDSAIQLEDEGVSRRHVKVLWGSDGSVRIQDLQSTNGTYCDGVRVEAHMLQDGEKVQLGNATILKFSYQDDLEESFQRQLYESATRDNLTRLYNRKFFVERLRAEFSYALRHGTPLTLVLLDVDHFKRINDSHGHPCGDYVLAKLGAVLLESVRGEDVLARWGGEEFGLILRACPADHGYLLADRIRRKVEATVFQYAGKDIPLTVSAGFATLHNGNFQTPESLTSTADQNLYQAKRGGRNKVEPAVTRLEHIP
jgi:two-component system, cell cycle response regulator